MQSQSGITKKSISLLLIIGFIGCVFISESMCGKNKGGGNEDIILYNGNIVMRGGGKKGKGGGSIVVANSHGGHKQHVEFMPMMWGWGGHGGH